MSTQKFFRLSYLNMDTQKYGAGWDDAYFVMFWVIAFFGIRVTVMEYILFPLADLGGLRSKNLKIKFVEQAWVLVYDTATCSLGFVSTKFLCKKRLLTAPVYYVQF